MKFSTFKRERKIKKVYAFHEIPRDQKTIEFGWIEVAEIDITQPVVISDFAKPKQRGVATLQDYEKYFERLTALTPQEFIEKWEPSPKELEIFWKKTNPKVQDGFGDFLLSLAYLIRDHKPFEMFGKSYFVEVLNEQDRDQEGKVLE